MKKLEGIHLTPELLQIANTILKTTTNIPQEKTNPNPPKLQSAKATACAEYTPTKAYHIIKGFLNETTKKQHDFSNPTNDMMIPIQVIKSIHTLLKIQTSDSITTQTLHNALQTSYLTFTLPKPPSKEERERKEKYQKRLEQLKLKDEERRYGSITNNIQLKVDEESHIKSMSYTTSIGLNMIVAPISFGVFMYFFSHQLFTWRGVVVDDNVYDGRKVDVKRVITAVISGVIMLFIEMILFVIRSHELEESIRKKKKVNSNASPFQAMK